MDVSQSPWPIDPGTTVAAGRVVDGNGVDLLLIDWMLAMTPAERLAVLQDFVDTFAAARIIGKDPLP
ncbi:MAG: hypothetical protein EXR72_15790 [Myxococcales bacterium]|nr:hypothetical protein [Myxococcales bacterium]